MAALYLLSLSSKGAIFLTFLYKISLLIRYKKLGRLCFLIAICTLLEFYNRALQVQAFLGFFFMDFASSLKLFLTNYTDLGCGFLIFGCFSRVCDVFVLLFVVLLGFKALKFRKGCSNHGDGNSNNGTTKLLSGDHNLELPNKVVGSNCGVQEEISDKFVRNEEEDEEGREYCDEDQVFDVMSLRKMVKIERRRANAARAELEKERMAASSAADEAMAMILRLQNEKSTLQMQANQMQRVAEEKQSYDQDVIQSLQWIILKHESERSFLEGQLRLCREKLRVYVKGEEWDQFDSVCPTPSVSHASSGSRFDDVLISSLNLESSPL